jgi:hypothetical protein
MKREVRFSSLWSDNDVFKIRISVWNGEFGGSADTYVPLGGLKTAAAQLAGFPINSSDTRELQFGSFGPEFAGGAVRMRFRCEDLAAHAIVELEIESERDGKGRVQSALLIARVEASAVDDFVASLQSLETESGGTAVLVLI